MGLESKDQSVEGQLEEPIGIMLDSGMLYAGQRRKAFSGKGLLGSAVLFFAAADVAARWSAGFGEHMSNEEPTGAVEPVSGLLFSEACAEQD